MKKFISVLLAMSLGFTMVGCGGGAAEGDSSEPATEADVAAADTAIGDKIVIGLDDSFPPMGYRDENNELVGFDIDLAKAAAEKMGVEVEFQPIDWDSKELELNSDKIQLIWNGFSITDERLAAMEFTKPYLNNRMLIVVPEGSDIKAKSDLAGKNVGVQDGSSAVDAIEGDEIHTQFASMPTYDTNLLALADLEIGRVDAVVIDEVVVKDYISKNPDKKFVLLDDDFGSEEYGIAAKKGNTELIDKLQTALDELSADGTAAEISEKWFGEDIVVKNN
ncbi:MAG: amino acid ABC transporter substrate-binding protein [Clostridia bacterium]|nr:amino acid ABC transporter substrate-binding protein [Clostridia bacterium]